MADGLTPPSVPDSGVALGVLTPDRVSADIETAKTAEQAAQYEQPVKMDDLASYVLSVYDENKRFRAEEIDEMLLEDLRQFNNEYDPSKLADLKRQGQPVIFMPATMEKCHGALSWIMDVINADNGMPFAVIPSPLPDLAAADEQAIRERVVADMQAYLAQGKPVSPGMMFRYAAKMRDQIEAERLEEAKSRATKMGTKIYDMMVEGNWQQAFSDFIFNLVWSPVAYIKGPIMRRVSVPVHKQGPFGWYEGEEKTIKPTFEAPSPFDVYPSRDAVTTDDGNLCERIRISPAKLEEMKGVPGYQDSAIDKLLATIPASENRESLNTDSERDRLEGKGTTAQSEPSNLLEGVELWGPITGKLLREHGVEKDARGNALLDLKVYEANVMLFGKEVVYVAINPSKSGSRPYAKSCWRKKAGSFYGRGVPRLMRELQQLINATVRSLCFNMGQASGFQTSINDMSRVPPGEKITESYAGKVWMFHKGNPGDTSKPLDFWQPSSNAPELLAVYKSFKPEADTITGIPAYSYGTDASGNSTRSATGLGMLMTNSARGIKMVLAYIDADIYRVIVKKLFDFLMIYGQDDSIKGDMVIQCSGALSQIVNEQYSEKIVQMLSATANPLDAAVVGPEQRGALWREFAKSLNMPKDTAVKTEEAIKEYLAKQEQAMAEQEQAQGQEQQPALVEPPQQVQAQAG